MILWMIKKVVQNTLKSCDLGILKEAIQIFF